MTPRAQLRYLLDYFEARYRLMPEDSASLGEDVSVFRSVSEEERRKGLDERRTTAETLKELVSVLEEEISQLQSLDSQIHNSEQPVANLPAELLAYIFELATYGVRSRDGHNLASPPSLPTFAKGTRNSINLACRRWRQVAVETSVLWKRVLLNFQHPKTLPNPDLLQVELERSGGRPLEIVLTGGINELHSKAFDAIRPLTIRCGLIHLWNFRDGTLGVLNDGSPLPHLHTLMMNWKSPPGSQIQIVDLTHAPVLKNLSIQYHSLTLPGLLLKIPQRCQITRMSFRGDIDPDNVIAAIRHCVLLETLEWQCDGQSVNMCWIDRNWLSSLGLPDVGEHPHLRHLALHNYIPLTLIGAFARAAPNLEHLVIAPWTNNNTPLVMLTEGGTRLLLSKLVKFSHLRCLQIKGDTFVQEHLDDIIIPFLRTLPSLEHIILSALHDPLAECLGNEAWLPNLKSVMIVAWMSRTDKLSALIALVERQAKNVMRRHLALKVPSKTPWYGGGTEFMTLAKQYASHTTVVLEDLDPAFWEWYGAPA